MTTAHKLAKQFIATVEQADACRNLMLQKLTKLQAKPKFSLFEFEEKLKHPYYLMTTNAEVVYVKVIKLYKDVGDWKIGNSTIEYEIDVIHANYITNVAGADAATVAKLQAMKKRARTADKAATELTVAFITATMLWGAVEKKNIRRSISNVMATKRAEDYIESPEIDITKDCKKLVAEIKKLNKELRGVKRGKESILDCYEKQQLMNLLKTNRRDSVLDILMK